MNRNERLHAVHEALRRAGDAGTTAARLAEELEVSTRTIKRDIDALQQTGAPIWVQHGPGGGYRLDPSASLPPVAFTPAQALAVSVALHVLPPASPFGADVRSAAAKLRDTLGPAARKRADALAERVWVLHHPGEARSTSTRVLRAVERSLAETLVMTITYRAARESAGVTRRDIEPIMVAWARGRWYVVAYCQLRDDIRWFRLDRIERADCTTRTYRPRPVAEVGEPPEGASPVGPGSSNR